MSRLWSGLSEKEDFPNWRNQAMSQAVRRLFAQAEDFERYVTSTDIQTLF
jgi:hypothetical protein